MTHYKLLDFFNNTLLPVAALLIMWGRPLVCRLRCLWLRNDASKSAFSPFPAPNGNCGLIVAAVFTAFCLSSEPLNAQPQATPELPACSDASATASVAAASVASLEKTKVGVQITELGCMRTLVLLDESALAYETLVHQRLSDVDFRVFPSAKPISGRVTPEIMKKRGDESGADLVLHATLSSRLKNKLGDNELYEAEATAQVYSPVTGELLVSHTVRANGTRSLDSVEAKRSAEEKVVDMAVREAIQKSLIKAHKILVYKAVIQKVADHGHLLAIMEHLGKMKDIYHVRQISHDLDTQIAEIEIMASPKSEVFWRTHLENMPKVEHTIVKVVNNPGIREKYPSWFSDAQN